MSAPFQEYLSKIASRMRHDLKGGLLTLKMGVESLDDEETLKPLLLDKAEELVQLSDKLVLLLRMGETKRSSMGVGGLARHTLSQVLEKFSELQVDFEVDDPELRWFLDPDALAYAVLELAQNAVLAESKTLTLKFESTEPGRALVSVLCDGACSTESEDWSHWREFGQSAWSRSGLGLSIVEGFVLAHQGELHLEPAESGLQVRLAFSVEPEA